jgi:branched-chain amino acid aminotransferase
MEIAVTLAGPAQRREKPGDESSLGFGKIFSDHMFLMRYREGTKPGSFPMGLCP